MIAYLYVALGSALGGVLRHWLNVIITEKFNDGFPWGVLFINIVGSFVIGFFAALTTEGRFVVSDEIKLFVMAGLCGGFTTFSAFSLQTLNLAQAGDFSRAGLNIILSVALCLFFVWMGYVAAGAINQMKGS